MKKLYKLLFVVYALLFSFQETKAQLLQSYNFTASAGNELSLPPTGQPLNGTLGDIRRGSGITPNPGIGTFSASGFTTATSLDTADYFEISVKANTNFKLNLDSIVFSERRSNTGIRNWEVYSSRNNFQTPGTMQGSFNVPDDNITRINQKIPFGTSIANVPSTETVTFRFYAYSAEAEAGTWRLDSIRVFGKILTSTPTGPSLNWQNTTATVVEGNTILVNVALSAISNSATNFELLQKSGTISGPDYNLGPFIPSNISIPAGQTSVGIIVNAITDALPEVSENAVWVIRSKTSNVSVGPDSLLNISITDAPIVPPTILRTKTIAQIVGNSTGNQADSVGKSFRVFGKVYGVNQRLTSAGGGYQMYLRDATGGIGIFKTTPVNGITTLNEGDSIRIMGKIEVFRGLSQINPDSIVVIATGKPLKNPTIIVKPSEATESDLIRINGVQLVDPTKWTTGVGATGFTVRVYKGIDTTDVRIDNDCPLYSQPAPLGTFDIIGMSSQFASGTTAPWNGGYQMIPRKLADLIITGSPTTKPTVRFTSTSLSFTESTGFQVAPISLDFSPSQLTTPKIFIKGGTASAISDYESFFFKSTTFQPNGVFSNLMPVDFFDDSSIEGPETLILVLRKLGIPSDTNYNIGADSIFTFTILDNDVLTEPLPRTKTIAQIKGASTGNQADSVGKSFRIYGTVYGLNTRLTPANAGYNMHLVDATGGIGIFKSASLSGFPTLNEGDSIKIMGKIEAFRGLSQINPDSIVLISTGQTLKAPKVVTKVSELEESQLVRINGVSLVDPTKWTTGVGTGGFTVRVFKGTDTTDVRIDNDGPLYNSAPPIGTFDIIGMGGQFVPGTPTPVAPYPATGYQLTPRRVADLIPVSTPTTPTASFSIASQTVFETGDSIRVTVQMNPVPTSPYNVSVQVKGGTAVSGTDYTPAGSNTISFGPGAAIAVFKIKLVDDLVLDGNKTLILALRPASAGIIPSALIGSDSIQTVTITDNEVPVVVEPLPRTKTITQIKGASIGNQADSVGKSFRIYGTVYGLNTRLTPANAGYNMHLVDATGGIGIFKSASLSGFPTLNEGDSIKIMGKIEAFRGLSQINPDSIVLISTGQTLKAPKVVTKVSELEESQLVRINGVSLVDPTKWTTGVGTGGFTVRVFKGTDTTDVRIDNDGPLYNSAPPIGTFDIIGMGGQFVPGTPTPVAPYPATGYQLTPRRLADLIPVSTPTTPTASFSIASQTVFETGDSIRVTVQMNPVPTSPYNVSVQVKGGTAVSGTDYTPAGSNTISFGPGAAIAVFKIKLVDDLVLDGNKTLILALRPASAGIIPSALIGSDSIQTVTITDNEIVVNPRPVLNFTSTGKSFTESNGDQTAPIAMSSAPSVVVQPTMYIKSGTASVGSDYSLFQFVATVAGPGLGLTNNLPVPFLDDVFVEGSETLTMVLRKQGLPGDTAYDIGPDSVFTFTILDNDNIVVEPLPRTKTIAQIIGSSTGNQADSVGKTFRVYGTVYGVNQRLTATTGGYQMYLRDATGGIGIFKTTPVNGITTLNEGDSIKIMGKIEVFRGLSQINPDSMVVIATGRTLKNPTVILKPNESTESDLLRINGVKLVDPTKWTTGVGATGFTVKVFKDNDTTDVRIDNDCPLYSQVAPTETFDIIGMGSQFAGTTAPWNGGYQLIPRRISDLIINVSVSPLCNCETSVKAYPNPGLEELILENKSKGKLSFQVFNSLGKNMINISRPEEFQKVDTKLWPSGIYYIKIVQTGKSISWIKK